MWQFWLVISGVFLVIEALTTFFFFFWFAIGALLAMISSFFITNVVVQSVIFLVSSTILVLCTKKLLKKFIKVKSVPTNVYSTIGRHGIVTTEINSTNGTGQIKVDGQVWSARCSEDTVIPEGAQIEIEKIDGVKAFVKAI